MQRWLWALSTEIPDLAGCWDSLRGSALPCQAAHRFPSSVISDSTVPDHHGNEAVAQLCTGGEQSAGSSLPIYQHWCEGPSLQPGQASARGNRAEICDLSW